MRITRRHALAGAAATAVSPFFLSPPGLPALVGPAAAAAPLVGTQVPGVHRVKVGTFEVTALLDGFIDLDLSLLPQADPAAARALLADAFRPTGGAHRSAVNAFLVNTGRQLVLIDAGTADVFGPTLGKLAGNLTAAGHRPDQVDAVLLTHMHPDHIAGIATRDGRAVFPNAELVVSEADWAFWTDQAIASRAPADVQPFFALAQSAASAYAGKVRRFRGEGEVVTGITAVALPGHTVGMSGYRIASENDQLLIWADLVHFGAIQFAQPTWSTGFDTDLDQARQTRLRTFDMVASDRILVAGAHLDFPGMGHVSKTGAAYAFTPMPWRYAP